MNLERCVSRSQLHNFSTQVARMTGFSHMCLIMPLSPFLTPFPTPQYDQDGPNDATETVLADQSINAATKECIFVPRNLSERVFRSMQSLTSAKFSTSRHGA